MFSSRTPYKMPMALIFPAAKRMILRPEPPSSPLQRPNLLNGRMEMLFKELFEDIHGVCGKIHQCRLDTCKTKISPKGDG